MNGFQPGQQLETEEAAKCERHFTLPMAVDVILLHLHVRAVPQHAFDHGRDLGGRAGFQLRIDAGGFLIDVPVHHDPTPSVSDMPLGHEVLIVEQTKLTMTILIPDLHKMDLEL